MNKPLSLSLLVLIACFGCNTTTKTETSISKNTDENKYCDPIVTPLLGQSYLSEKFLNTISKIKPNPEKKLSTEGMVLIEGGVFEMGG